MIDSDNKTVWCGNLADQVTEVLLYELFLQAGPLESVRIAKDRAGNSKNFAFITYAHEVSVPYAISLFRGTTLFNRTLTLQSRGRMALLTPPIRCYGPDPNMDLSNHPVVIQQFAQMAENLSEMEHPTDNRQQVRETNDKLVMASLQGNWTHRHHPYRAKEQSHSRDNYRRDHDNQRGWDKTGSWRDRRNNKKSNYHRRD